MATKKITLNELRTLVKQIIKEESEVDRYSNHSKDIDARLKKYVSEKEPNENWVDVKNYFLEKADPYNIKKPHEMYDIYFKMVNEFLNKNGY
jgi:hypothetical protein